MGLGQIKGGSWKVESIKDTRSYIGLKQRYEEGYEWKDTKYIDVVQEKIEENGEANGYKSLEEFIEIRCSYIDELFFDIKVNGYKPNYVRGPTFPHKDERNNRYAQKLEPLVTIGPDGEIYWRDGFHRYTIASILDIEIPVNILVRHKKWQQIRDRVRNNDIPKHIDLSHPDLQDIRPE